MTLQEQFLAAVEQERILANWERMISVKRAQAEREATRLARELKTKGDSSQGRG